MNLFGLTHDQISDHLKPLGEKPYRSQQVTEWLYHHHVGSVEAMSNLPARLRDRLRETGAIKLSAPEDAGESADGTRKYTWPAFGGDNYESAEIPDGRRLTLCLSSQAGCRIGCKFCLTAKKGLRQNLSPAEILSQYRESPQRDAITHFVFMGMGEPLDNLDAVLSSLEILTSPWGYRISPRRITVSTVGLLPHLDRLLDETQVNVAISLHAARREVRLPLVPSENQHPAAVIVQRLRERAKNGRPPFAGTGRRRLSFEVTMLKGVNDGESHAQDLRDLITGVPSRVNLIPWNSFPGPSFQPSSRDSILRYQTVLKRAGITTTIRESRGQDIGAACGLLAGRRDAT